VFLGAGIVFGSKIGIWVLGVPREILIGLVGVMLLVFCVVQVKLPLDVLGLVLEFKIAFQKVFLLH
jgi:ABC-type uncharacterized transport system permease subunit